MIKLLALLLLAFSLAHCSYPTPSGCTPYGVRLAVGRNYFSELEKQIVSIWFNTRLECPQSFVTIEKASSIKKVYCGSKRIAFSNFSSYVHKCSIDILERGDQYQYMAFGWTGSVSDPAIPFKSSNIKTRLFNDNGPTKILALADWSYLQLKAGQYEKLDNAFDTILKSDNQPDMIYMNGDYAYDLSSNNGTNYDNFLIMMSQIASVWPCVINSGNHEYKTLTDYFLLNSTFQLYNLTQKNLTTLKFGTFTLIMFDPYGILYEKADKLKILAHLKNAMNQARTDKPIIVASHYPLVCSGQAKDCSQVKATLKQYFDLMIDYRTVLYLGAHYHTYQRTYPYTKSGQFKKIPSPYKLSNQQRYLISIVQGIAGNDKSIVESYTKVQNYTAALSYNHTGFGMMTIDRTKLIYEHYNARDMNKPEDSALIDFSGLFKSKVNLRQE